MLGMPMILLCIYLVGFVCIAILVGGYVYSDARSHGMKAVVWTVIAVLAPAFTGFILYLLVRLGHMEIPRTQKDDSAAVKKSDRAVGRIITAAVVIPVIMLSAAGMLSLMRPAASRATGVTSFPLDEYLQEADNPQIKEWLYDCVDNHGGEMDRAYILRNKSKDDGQLRVRYLVYMPCLIELPHISVGADSGFFGRTVNIEVAAEGGSTGNTLLIINCEGSAVSRLRLFYGSRRIKCEITDVEYELGLVSR